MSPITGSDHTYSSANGDKAAAEPTAETPPAPTTPARPQFDSTEIALGKSSSGMNGSGPGYAAPSINVFGEFDGVERAAQRSVAMGGFEQHTYCDEGYDADVTVDPTGATVVYASTRNSEHTNLYLQRVDGLAVTQLTSEDADDAFPTFSPDGKQIAFSSTRGGNWNLYVMDIDGRNVTQVTSGQNQDLHPSFSPDGTRLVYCSMGPRATQWELWTVNLQTNQKKMVGVGLFPAWSPDRSRDVIAFQRARQRGSRWFSLWTTNLIDGEARMVTEVAVSGNAALVSPTWSGDGKRLAFATIVSPSHSNGKKLSGQQDIWTVNADGTNRHRLTDGTGTNATPCWASDNRVYFVSNRGGTECIWSTPANSPGSSLAAISRAQPSMPFLNQSPSAVAGIPSGVPSMPSTASQPATLQDATSSGSGGSDPANSLGNADDQEIGH
jgi:TolB protein